MKVAIVGAGLSGICCAYELKKHGIIPTIYERGSSMGGKLDFPALSLRMYITPYRNPFKYLSKNYDINIIPHSKLNEISMISENKILTVKSHIGYWLSRPPHHDAIDYQIQKNADLTINFNSTVEIQELMEQFDYVVVATSDMRDVKKFSSFSQNFNAYVRIAHILGDFKVDSAKIWFNTNYARHGYAYLAPISPTEARLILIVDNISASKLDYYWNKFLLTENIKYQITETRDIEHIIGYVTPIQHKNIYFTGNNAGLIDSFMGFGAMRAMISGATAARCIIKNLNYNELMMPFIKDNYNKYEFRKAINFFTNKHFDRFILF